MEKLHSKFPEASISILVRKGNEYIYSGHPFLKETLVWNKGEGKIKNLFKLLFQIRRNKYDLVVNCHRFASSGLLTSFSGAHHKAGYKQTPFSYLLDHAPKHTFGDGKHEVERYNQLIEDFTGKEFFLPKIYPTLSDFEKVKPYQNVTYMCMAPSSVWYTKQLPIEKWIELCDQISDHLTIYILGASSDKALAQDIIQKTKHKNISSLCGELSLLQSAALMSKAKMNYVNDSGPLHLASATNSPVTAFFCSTVKEFGFYPLSELSKVIDAGEMNCRPCGMHGHKQCPKGHFNCGKQISIKDAIV